MEKVSWITKAIEKAEDNGFNFDSWASVNMNGIPNERIMISSMGFYNALCSDPEFKSALVGKRGVKNYPTTFDFIHHLKDKFGERRIPSKTKLSKNKEPSEKDTTRTKKQSKKKLVKKLKKKI